MKTKYPSFFGLLAMLMLVASFVVPTSLVHPSAVQAGICKWDNLAEPGAAPVLNNITPNEILDYSIASDGTNMKLIARVPHALLGGLNELFDSPAYTGLFWSLSKYPDLVGTPGFIPGYPAPHTR
jgi:hypothetical protein